VLLPFFKERRMMLVDFKLGIIDPTKVSRCALQNAASVAGLMLTTEVMITELPEEKKEAAGGHAGHNHGMEGMY
ncbi:MAG TPA: hypothetical protein PK614_03865, partial [Nitrospira sp.]|nr:hypothetical protein [Nitrospira sp.]